MNYDILDMIIADNIDYGIKKFGCNIEKNIIIDIFNNMIINLNTNFYYIDVFINNKNFQILKNYQYYKNNMLLLLMHKRNKNYI